MTLIAGVAIYLFAGRRPAWLREGAFMGALVAWVGFFAARWLVVCHAWAMMGWFSGTLLNAVMPLLVAGSLAAVLVARQQADFGPIRAPLVAMIFLGWAGTFAAAEWRLYAAYGYGPKSLSEAAGVAGGDAAPDVAFAWLRPSTTTAAGYETVVKRAAIEGVDVEGENLIKLYSYLKERDYRGVFARQALTALRKGWFFWWDADRALESAMIARPGFVAPDYLPALGLLRSGPLTIDRFQKLHALHELGRARKAGFEDVNRSQLIFEAFSAAYARFGDDEGMREWLYKVDNLWPIYEKKVEASPVESFHDGEISGAVDLSGGRPSSVLVGLFLVSPSTFATISKSTPTLSQSDFPDANGRFAFRDLGAGTYFLGLEGAADALSGGVDGSPGYIHLGADFPAARLEPIRVREPKR